MTDLISRQDAIALLESLKREKPLDWFDGDYSNGIGDCIEALTNMPNAIPKTQVAKYMTPTLGDGIPWKKP